MAPSANVSAATWARIGARLNALLGCPVETLREPGTHTLAHGPGLSGYQGVYIWATHGAGSVGGAEPSVIVSAPQPLLGAVHAALAGQPTEAALDPAIWTAALGVRIERIVGPSYQGYLDAGVFHPLAPNPARRLRGAERGALAALTAACPAEEWAHSAIQADDDPIFIAPGPNGVPLAAASLTDEGAGGLMGVGVITHPAARGRGLGRAVVSALSAWALARGHILHYQTLHANTASVAIARALGYQDVASALAVRLRAEGAVQSEGT